MTIAFLFVTAFLAVPSHGFLPFIDGGREIPALYQGYFNGQIGKQASAAVGRAVAAGYKNIEVNFPPVPNLDEVRFGTPLNKKFGTQTVAKSLQVKGGYKPGSDLSRQQVAFANMYWAKMVAPSLGGLFGANPNVYSAEPVTYSDIQSKGSMAKIGPLNRQAEPASACIVVNPGGEETWSRVKSLVCKSDSSPFLVLNNSYSTTYGLGNKRGYEEAYYLKRISKGWIFRSYPGNWKAYLEKPNGQCELLVEYEEKPQLNEVAALVREESFSRYAINNDRWSAGFGERL